jgi:hypothetical protein
LEGEVARKISNQKFMNKTIYLPTNFNNKLACSCFIHVDEAPRSGIPESRLEETVIEIRTSDNSHPPVKTKLFDIIRLKLGDLPTSLTWQSHAVDAITFAEKLLTDKPKLNTSTPMAVYFYQRID